MQRYVQGLRSLGLRVCVLVACDPETYPMFLTANWLLVMHEHRVCACCLQSLDLVFLTALWCVTDMNSWCADVCGSVFSGDAFVHVQRRLCYR